MQRRLFLVLRYRVWLAICISAFGWGSGDVVTRQILEEGVGPYTLAFLRTAIAAACLVACRWILRGFRTNTRNTYRLITVQALFAWAIPVVLITLALQHASAGFVGVVFALAPISTAGLAHFMIKNEKISAPLIFGLITAIAGVAVLLASGHAGLADGGEPKVAFTLTFIAACLVGYAYVYARRVSEDYDPLALTEKQFLLASLVLGVVMIGGETYSNINSVEGWLRIIYLGVVGTLIPIYAVLWSLKNASATLTSLGAYIAPVVAFVGGVWLLDEQLQRGLVIGGAIILAGVVVADRVDRDRTISME